MSNPLPSPFNSALETGVRTLTILVESYPRAHDLNRLVQYDYLVVHSADANGPPSIHPPLPMRTGELLIRRGLIESGLRLLMSRALVLRVLNEDGMLFQAQEAAGAFLNNIRAPYLNKLRERAKWVVESFDQLGPGELDELVNHFFSAWTTEFQSAGLGAQEDQQ